MTEIPSAFLHDKFCFIGKTDEELSLVCESAHAPSALERSDGWRGMRIEGVLDFSLVGIISKIAHILAVRGISIFAVSTYNTDYLFIKEEVLDDALCALKENDYTIV